MLRPFLVLSALALLGCIGDSSGGVVDPGESDSDQGLPFETHKDLVFSPGLWMNLYVPKKGTQPFPAVVLIHGGGWSSGTRGDFLPEALHLASNGLVAGTIDYRLAPAHVFPAALQDVKAAIRWLRANADAYSIDASQIAVMGGYEGGHLAAMVGTTEGVAQFEGEENPGYSSAVQAVVAISSQVDLPSLWSGGAGKGVLAIERFLGSSYQEDPALWAIASPISYVSQASAPFLLLHGIEDTEVPFAHAEGMRDALMAAGAHVELFSAQGGDHEFFFSVLWNAPGLEAITDFFTRILK
ncbi:MAG: alpha/beta hydrolase [Gemmatimonadetes bacterium]|nr:alpha/beta hydrolase [Gemmatimonadota bacterium]NNM03586.1 alpha/beta hydrolase [Gemmatimonadota bacterium]